MLNFSSQAPTISRTLQRNISNVTDQQPDIHFIIVEGVHVLIAIDLDLCIFLFSFGSLDNWSIKWALVFNIILAFWNRSDSSDVKAILWKNPVSCRGFSLSPTVLTLTGLNMALKSWLNSMFTQYFYLFFGLKIYLIRTVDSGWPE